MMTKTLRLRLLAATSLLSLLAVPAAYAAEGMGSASVEIVQALGVEETTALSFGTISPPSTGTQQFTLDYTDGTVTAGVGDGKVITGGTAGVFKITGAPEQAVNLAVTIGEFDGAGITVVAAHINGTSDTVAEAELDETGELTANIGGVIQIANTVVPTEDVPYTAVVTVTVLYN